MITPGQGSKWPRAKGLGTARAPTVNHEAHSRTHGLGEERKPRLRSMGRREKCSQTSDRSGLQCSVFGRAQGSGLMARKWGLQSMKPVKVWATQTSTLRCSELPLQFQAH